MDPKRRRRPGLFACRMNDAQLAVWNTARQFQGVHRRCGANSSVCSAWQGFQLGITARCWLRPRPPEQRSSRHRTPLAQVHAVVKRSSRCDSVFVFCGLMMLGAAVQRAFGSISTSSYGRSQLFFITVPSRESLGLCMHQCMQTSFIRWRLLADVGLPLSQQTCKLKRGPPQRSALPRQ